MSDGAKPDRADVCIIGAGASGAAAAKVLTERGFRVVMLERGPWRTKETFGGDELANINRYNLWPDPLLNPRTVVPTHYDNFFRPLGQQMEFVSNVQLAALPGEIASVSSDTRIAALPRADL